MPLKFYYGGSQSGIKIINKFYIEVVFLKEHFFLFLNFVLLLVNNVVH